MLISAVAYSLFAVFSKDVLADGLRPTDLVVWRFCIAVPVAWLVVGLRSRRGGPRATDAPIVPMLGLGVLFGLLALLAFAGLDHLPAALYTVVIYTYPTMVAVGAWMLGRPAPLALWGALIVTMAGIALTVPEVFSSNDADVTGLVLTLLNAAFYAVYVLVSGRLMEHREHRPRRFDGLVASTWSLTGSLLFAAGIALFTDVRGPSSWRALAGLTGLAVISTVLAGSALMLGLTSLTPATAATIATLEPVLTLVWAVLLLGETLGAVQIVGAGLVLVGVAWAQRTQGAEPVHVLPPDATAGVDALDLAPRG